MGCYMSSLTKEPTIVTNKDPSNHPIDLNSIDISTVKNFTFDGIVTDCKVIDVIDGDTIKVMLLFNDKPILLNIRMFGYDAPSIKSKKSSQKTSTNGKRAKQMLINLVTDCSDKINENTRSKDITKIIRAENKKIVKIHLMDFDKYDEIFAKIYLADQNKFVDEIMLESNLVYTYKQDLDSA